MKKMLGVFAHPDDESFVLAGSIAKYAKAGWQIELICASRCEIAGEEKVRHKELESVAGLLGCHAVTFMDYKDGMLSAAPSGDIEDKLLQIYIVRKPDIIITFDPTGINNNSDHIRLSLSATYAFQTYAKLRDKENPKDENPPKLYYACIPESVVEYLQKQEVIPVESHGKPWRGADDKLISTVIDIKRQGGIKKKALKVYANQSDRIEQLLQFSNNPMIRQEYFVLRMVGLDEAFMGKNDIVSDRF